jgi:hypothetical protein
LVVSFGGGDTEMSRHINVNPGQYKVAGREKPGKPLGIEEEAREAFARSRKQERAAAPKEPPAPKQHRKR